jgi:hypothetical protein
MGRSDVEGQLVHQPRQPGCLAFREVKDHPSKRRRVDDRMLERPLEAASDQPGVERIVAVLDEHSAVGEAKESASGVLELRRSDQHRAFDVVTLAGIRIDGRAAVDQSVEEGKGAAEAKPLRSDLQDEERGVAGRLDVEGDELCVVQRGLVADLRRIDGNLLPGDRLAGPARLEKQRLGAHRATTRARRAQSISSRVRARSRRTAAP